MAIEYLHKIGDGWLAESQIPRVFPIEVSSIFFGLSQASFMFIYCLEQLKTCHYIIFLGILWRYSLVIISYVHGEFVDPQALIKQGWIVVKQFAYACKKSIFTAKLIKHIVVR